MKFMTMLTVPAFLIVLCALPLRSIGKPSPDDNMARMGLMADTSMPSRLGSVSFNISCKPQVRAEFNRGIALLHSFWLDEAGKSFGNVAAADPDCAMAYWGVAMADFNQVNGGPTDTGVVAANRALRMAAKAREKDPREAAYIHAVHLFFDGYTEKDFDVYSKRYTDAMEEVATHYPNDLEAQVFYALALINSAPRDDVALINPKKAVAILYPIFRQHPDHPGIAHYIIHACDNPVMAQQGLEAARRYASIAPAAPHALHMPGHIFARLGLWGEDIRSNLASKAASENPTAHVGAENRLHAMEFLEYAYLQIGYDDEAWAIVTEGSTVKQSNVDTRYPSYYADAEARNPALFAIETRDWALATSLKPIEGADWVSESQTLLAHAVAAAHLHDAQGAKAAAQSIESLTEANPRMRVGTPRASVPDETRAWAHFSQGDLQGAIRLLRSVADRQGKIGKGEVELPAREMLAEMFFLSGDFSQALHEYQVSLTSDPNRFNALLGAGQAAEGLGYRDVAAGYYQTLLANCTNADGNALTALIHPRAVVQEMHQANRSRLHAELDTRITAVVGSSPNLDKSEVGGWILATESAGQLSSLPLGFMNLRKVIYVLVCDESETHRASSPKGSPFPVANDLRCPPCSSVPLTVLVSRSRSRQKSAVDHRSPPVDCGTLGSSGEALPVTNEARATGWISSLRKGMESNCGFGTDRAPATIFE